MISRLICLFCERISLCFPWKKPVHSTDRNNKLYLINYKVKCCVNVFLFVCKLAEMLARIARKIRRYLLRIKFERCRSTNSPPNSFISKKKNKIYYYIVDNNFKCSEVSTGFYYFSWWTEWDEEVYIYILYYFLYYFTRRRRWMDDVAVWKLQSLFKILSFFFGTFMFMG